jgi:hypothetical protein
MTEDAGVVSWHQYNILGKRGTVPVIINGTVDVVPSKASGTLVYPGGEKCDWAYSAPLLDIYDGYSDTFTSGNAFSFVCDSYNCGRYACASYMLKKTCYDSKGVMTHVMDEDARVMRGCVGFSVDGYD